MLIPIEHPDLLIAELQRCGVLLAMVSEPLALAVTPQVFAGEVDDSSEEQREEPPNEHL